MLHSLYIVFSFISFGIIKAFGRKSDGSALPNATMLFGSVRATNKAGLMSVGSSNGIVIDTTLPVAIFVPTFSLSQITSIIVNVPDEAANYQV